MKRPLEGITVVGLEQVIAGPFCTRQLAELGARVIKLERTGGGDAARGYDHTVKGLSSHFAWVNRSKESLCLDLKHPGAKEILGRLMAKADVFVQNLAPGAAERLGLGAAELRARHPRLVWCGISGYGPGGPYAAKKAYDLLVQCEAGLPSVTGTPEAPAKAGIPVADIAAGMYALSSILAALGRLPRHHRALRPVQGRRRRHGVPLDPERKGIRQVLRRRADEAGTEGGPEILDRPRPGAESRGHARGD
jgi:crotonobetainyl-CoA:carnitine CoA-transferase CaiB-like acyl-CoA transferase